MNTRRSGVGSEADSHQPIFPAEQAFVVQFGNDAVLGNGCLGRVEHVVSGHSSRFASGEELYGFMNAIRREVAGGGATTGDTNHSPEKRRENE